MQKIIPIVLVLALSLIIGNQAAFAQTDVWAFYGETHGSAIDATNPGDGGTPPLSTTTGIAGVSSTFQITDGIEEYQNVVNALFNRNNNPGATSGPILVAECFFEVPNPSLTDADWIFGVNDAVRYQCVQNQRAAQDLGIGVMDIVESPAAPLVQPLEVETGQVVVIDLGAILGTHENFMFRISSNSEGESAWVAVSDKKPDGLIDFDVDFTPLGTVIQNGFFAGCDRDNAGCLNNDKYISFDPKRYFYYTQTDNRQDNLLQQIKADRMEIVGGHGGITDNTALLVSGSHLTASWMIPLLVSAIGIGVFVFTRKQ